MPYSNRSGHLPRNVWMVVAMAAGALGFLSPAAPTAGAEAAQEEAVPPPMPAAPAFYTASMSRIHHIGPAVFTFEDDAGKRFQIRLSCADCSKVYDRQQGLAQTVSENILRAEPVWIFPCGADRDAPDPIVYACVWTKNGWLAERLIKAGYALRREGLSAALLQAPPAIHVDADKARLPEGGAYCASTLTPADGDAFEVQRGDRTVKIRLFDVACQGAVSDAAAACCDEKPVWVFPCGPSARGPAPARIWTAHGWLHERLLARHVASRYENPYKPGTTKTASGSSDPVPTPPSRPSTGHSASEKKPKFTWRQVSVTLSTPGTPGKGQLHIRTNRFEISSPFWRVTWEAEPVFSGNAVVVNVFKVRPSGIAATIIWAGTGRKGQHVVQRGPGTYYVNVTSPKNVDLTIEEAVPLE